MQPSDNVEIHETEEYPPDEAMDEEEESIVPPTSKCRLCLSPLDIERREGVPLFVGKDNERSIAHELLGLFRLQFEDTPGWPSYVCLICLNTVAQINRFKENIVISHVSLYKEMVLSKRIQEYIPEEDSDDESIEDTVTTLPPVTGTDNANEPVLRAPRTAERTSELENLLLSMKLLSCHPCQTSFDSYFDLQTHMRQVHSSVAFVECCAERRFGLLDILDHMEFHLEPDKYQCLDCNLCLDSYENLFKHRNKDHPQNPLPSQTLAEDNEIDQSHPDPSGQPEDLPEPESEDDETIEEIVTESGNAPRTLERTTELENLLLSMKLLQCHPCHKEFDCYFDLQTHMKLEHSSTVAFVECCGEKRFGLLDILDHMEFHLEPEKFKCADCDLSFDSYENLFKHRNKEHPQGAMESISQEKAIDLEESIIHEMDQSQVYELSYDHNMVPIATPQPMPPPVNIATEPGLTELPPVRTPRSKEATKVLKQLLLSMKVLKCHACAMSFKSYLALQVHMRLVHYSVVAFIDCCGEKRFGLPDTLDHMEFHLNSNTFQCADCKLCLDSHENLSKHRKKVHTNAPFQCDQCGKTCGAKFRLRTHLLKHLPVEQRPEKCPICPKWFISHVKEHVERMHDISQRHECEICGKFFASQTTLDNHVAKHMNTLVSQIPTEGHQHRKAVLCKICGEQFMTLNMYQRHMDKHMDRKYPCPKCESVFDAHQDRFLHMRSEHPEEFIKRTKIKLGQEQGQVGVSVE